MAELEVEVKEVVDQPTGTLCCHWTEEELIKFDSITSKWKGDCWGYLFDIECLPSWVYELTFDEFMVKLTKDKDEKSMEDVLAEYTGCDYLFG
tara:strand:+ start:268 stop:546 length:279 start_codon:yes stop_codon:yes gene_type:complete